MQWVDDNILFLIFGHVNISDIKHLFLVCKRWNNLGKHAPFWQPFVERKLKGFPVCTHNAAMFHKYSSSLKLGFGWVFCKKGPEWFETAKESNAIILNENDWTEMCLRDGKQVSNICYCLETFNLYERFVLLHRTLKYLKTIERPSFQILEIRYEQDGIKFVGSTNDKQAQNYGRLLPHGGGTWTFPDGSTFSGDKVACDGFPHGKGLWNGKEEVEFEFGHRVTPTYKRRKIKF